MPPVRSVFRERRPDKDIGPQFRFRAHNDSERVTDYLNNNGLSHLQIPPLVGGESR